MSTKLSRTNSAVARTCLHSLLQYAQREWDDEFVRHVYMATGRERKLDVVHITPNGGRGNLERL